MDADMADIHYFCVFLVYKGMQRSSIGNAGGKETKYRGICFLPDKKTLRIHGGRSTGSDGSFDFRAWRKTNPCETDKFHVICVEWFRKPKSSYSTLWVNGAYVSNFDSTASFGSERKLTLGNIIDGGDAPFLGTITAVEIYFGITEGVPGPVKKEIMKAPCRDYGVDIEGINPSCDDMIIDPGNGLGSFASRRHRERSWISWPT